MNEKERIEKLEKLSKYIRTKALETILIANNGHIGGNLSSVELLTTLYFGGLFNFDPNDSKNPNRDRVLIRGHEGPLRYTIFSLLGYIKPEELNAYRSLGSRLQGHEDMHECPGVDITPSGSLGMLLSYGVGSAISNSDKGINARTVVYLGDGEEQEGNISEAARHASSLKLNNLICILDKNKKQLSRPTEYSDGESNIKQIWEGYGWNVIEIVNGNSVSEVLDTYKKVQNLDKPTLIIANTTKGLGVDGALDHFSGYHTLSAIKDKTIAIRSLQRMKDELQSIGIGFEETREIALSLVEKPKQITIKENIPPNSVYNIKTIKSGINLEEAQDDYISQIKENIIKSGKHSNFYFVTPDLLKTDVVEQIDFDRFAHFIDTGIREQHAIAMCHGISVENPNARIYVCYGDAFAFRALDQINAAATGKSNIVIVGENSGVFQGQNGKTHQSVAQPGALISIPELEFYEPADSVDLYNSLTDAFTKNNGVSYIRFHRGTVNIQREEKDINNSVAYFIHRSGKNPDLVIISSGFMAENAVKVAESLEKENNMLINVINVVRPKRFNEKAEELLTNDAPIITLYNGNPKILSQTIANSILENPNLPRPKSIYAHGYESGTSGTVPDLMKYYNFDELGIKKLVLSKVKK